MDDRNEFSKLIEAGGISLLIGLAIGLGRSIVNEKYGSFIGFLRCVLASGMVAVLVGWGLEGTTFSLTTRSMLVGVTALIADDVLVTLVSISRIAARDPIEFFLRLAAAYRGQIPPPASPVPPASPTEPKDAP